MADEDSPFSDPAVLRHQQQAFPDYALSGQMAGNNEPTATQYTLPSSQARPPAYTSTQKPISNEELLKQQEALEQKAAELERKERDLNARAAQSGPRTHNFPPLPSFVPLQPCFYQDFDVDIASEFRQLVKYLYWVYLVQILMFLLNFIGCIIYLAYDRSNGGATLVYSLVYLLVSVPCSYVCWFRAVYNAFRSDSSFNFFLFFFMFFINIVFLVLTDLGISGWGSVGWIATFRFFGDSQIFGGVYGLFISVGFLLLIVAEGMLLTRVHGFYRTSDASFAKAQSEFSSGVMSNKHVQNAAASAARNAATGGTGGNP